MLSGAAALALAAASASAALGMPMTGSMMMPKCSPASGPVVWWTASSKTYSMKGTPRYGKGSGKYVCRATAVHAGGKPAPVMSTKGSMGHGAMGGSAGGPSNGGGMMGSPMTMAPRPPSAMPMPNGGNVGAPSSGNQGNTGAPGAGGQVPNNPAAPPASPMATPHP